MPDASPQVIPELVARLAQRLLAQGLVVATAESCTGGGIAQALTSRAGSSVWFDTGFVTYSNAAKQRLLQVPAALFAPGAPGAVSEEAVRAMAAGALANSEADLAVAVSGVAGPDGGTGEKPVGTVWIAWQWRDQTVARRFQFAGDRAEVRHATVIAALEGLLLLVGE